VVQLTDFGKTVLDQRNSVMGRVEEIISEKIGSENFQALKEVLDSDWDL
jgi:hypothetical protein